MDLVLEVRAGIEPAHLDFADQSPFRPRTSQCWSLGLPWFAKLMQRSSLSLLYEIAHPFEQFYHLGKPQIGVPRLAVLPECMKLARGDLVSRRRRW